MLKKLLIASALTIVASNMVIAAPAPYVGAGLGIVNNSPNKTSFNNFRGVPVNLFTGYGGMVNQNIYLAGELGATIATGELSNTGNSLKTNYGYSASIIPGIMVSDYTLAFVKAGVVRSHFSSFHKTVTGGQVGIGLQTSLTQNVDLRGEYDFTAYRSIKNTHFSSSGTTPRSDAFNLALIYKFE